MQEAEEQDTCRICSAPAEPDQPLFHPCKCSGTIRYIHQDCLTTWLAHSKKKTCDVCKHPYKFTKVYDPNMPQRLPALLLIKRIIQQLVLTFLLGLRAFVVLCVWLGFVPYITVLSWRMLFGLGEVFSRWAGGQPVEERGIFHPSITAQTVTSRGVVAPGLILSLLTERSSADLARLLNHFATDPTWASLPSDIFTGQIIASLMVLTFLAVFLLREWITQNRPGAFEDEEELAEPERPAPPQPAPPQPAPLQLAPLQVAPLQFPPPQPAPAAVAPPVWPVPVQIPAPHAEQQAVVRAPIAEVPQAVPLAPPLGPPPIIHPMAPPRPLRPLRRRRTTDDVAGRSAPADPQRAAVKERLLGREAQLERNRKHMFARRVHAARNTRFGFMTDANVDLDELDRGSSSSAIPSGAAFTFNMDSVRMPTRSMSEAPESSTPRMSDMFSKPIDMRPEAFDIQRPFAAQLQPRYRPWPMPENAKFTFTSRLPESRTPITKKGESPFSVSPDLSSIIPPIPTQPSKTPADAHPSQSLARSDESASVDPRHETKVDRPRRLLLPSASDLQVNGFASSSNLLPEAGPSYAHAADFGDAPIDEDLVEPPPSTYPSHTLPRIAELSRSRRPPMLPSTSLPPSPLDQPLASPSHATYTAPEELDADITHVPSTTKLQGYFDREEVHAGKRVERAEYFDHEEGSSTGLRRRDSARDMRTVAAMYPERDQREYDRYFAENTAVEESDEELMLGSDEDAQVAMDLADASDLRADTAGSGDEIAEENDLPDGRDQEEDAGIEIHVHIHHPGQAVQPPEPAVLRQPREPVQNARQADEDVPGLDPEDLDGNADDDMDGALEAIGLRGPLLGIFSNAALMTMFLDAATIVGVFTPFVIGKTAVLLTLNPPHLLRILHFPIRVMRIFTDPVVDSAAFFFMRVVLPLSFGFLKVSWGIVAPAFSEVVDVNYVAESIEHAYPNILRLAGYDQPTVVETVVEQTESSHLFSVAEHYFAVLGKAVRENTVSFRQTWVQLSLGTGPSERTFAVFVGYFVASVLVAVYLNILTVGNMLNASRAVRNSIRQQLLVLKVAMFILIELGLFPLGCGTVLDLCSLWFFPEASFLTRTTFFMHAPVTAMFYHWVAGTLFMYTFAALLSGCRNIMRPGAMWFIKDPQDQNSHPIRDILERPAVTQLRKILTSAFMYAFVVFCAVGSIAGLFLLGKKSIMPLRWKPREPLSNVPVDLVFLNLALPYTIRYFRPKKTIKLVSIFTWKQLSTRLRLTSYFFGGRYPDEEHSPKSWKHSVQRFVTGRCREYTTTSDGSFRRVPASDQMALPRDMSATVVVTEFGQPLDEDGRKLIAEQDAEAVKARHMVKDDYAVVYFPPSLGYRVISFITILWALGVMALGVAFALPLVIGRTFFAMFIPYEVHDGYSFILGFYLLWTCFVASKAVDRLDKRRQRTGGDLPRGDLRVLVVKRGLLWATKISYMILFLGVIVPVLIGFVVDLYLILPVRMALDPTMIPRLRVIDSWALGLLYGKIAWLVMKHRRGAGISRGLQRIKNNGWTHPDPVYATKEVIIPLTVGLLGMILFPPLVLKTILFVIPIVEMDDRFFFTHLYPVIFASAAICHAAMVMFDMVSAWSQTIRDKEFLVEMRLRNHESDKETEENPSTKGKQPQSNK